MTAPRRRRALVTGASTGVGAAFARLLSQRGYDLVLVGRDRARLESVAADLPSSSHVLVADLAQEEGLAAVESHLRDERTAVDLLVNNAAAGRYGPVVAQNPDDLADTITLNISAVVRLCRAALPSMLASQTGGVINMSSLASRDPYPDMAAYAATKAFVDSWTRSIRAELSGTGVTVTLVRPGWVRTEFHARAGQSVDDVSPADWLSADVVAQRAIDAYVAAAAEIAIGQSALLMRGIRRARSVLREHVPWMRDVERTLIPLYRQARRRLERGVEQ